MKLNQKAWLLVATLLVCLSVCATALIVWIGGTSSQEAMGYSIAELVDNEGNKVYRFALEEGAVYEDGTPMSAQDYLCVLLLRSSPEWTELASDESNVKISAKPLTPDKANAEIRLISENTFEVAKTAENELVLSIAPCPPEKLGLELRDDGDGVYLVGDVEKAISLLLGTAEVTEFPSLSIPLGVGEEGEESRAPETEPTDTSTEKPTEKPNEVPTGKPTEEPTEKPTEEPTEVPTEEPTAEPTEEIEEETTPAPTEELTEEPTGAPPAVPDVSLMNAIQAAIAGNGAAYVRTSENNVILYESKSLEVTKGVIQDRGSLLLATGYSERDDQDAVVRIILSDGEKLVDGYVELSRLNETAEDVEATTAALKDSLFALKGHPIAVVEYAADEKDVADAPQKEEEKAEEGAGNETEETVLSEDAQSVFSRIAALPDTIALNGTDIEQLYEVWLAYQALPEEDRAALSNAEKLEGLWASMREALPMGVLLVVNAIDALPGELATEADMMALQHLIELLMSLTDEQIPLVYNANKLWALMSGVSPMSIELDESISYTARLAWENDEIDTGARPETLTLTLYANDAVYEGAEATLEINPAQADTYVWSGLPDKDDQGETIVYSVKQSTARGYRTTYAFDTEKGETVITNTRLEGGLTLSLMEGQNFRIRYASTSDITTVVAQYTTYLLNEKQTLRVILPPFFTLAAPPSSGIGYKVTTQSIPLPAEYYPGEDAALLRAEIAARTNCTQITVAFDESVSGNFVLTFGINITPSIATTSSMQYLSELMVKYGESPETIPLNIIAIAEDGEGNLLNDVVYEGTSAITTADGSSDYEAIVSFPRKSIITSLVTSTGSSYTSTAAGYYYDIVAVGARQNSSLVTLASWHYPYTDMYIYLPLPEGTQIGYLMGSNATPGTASGNFWMDGVAEIDEKPYARVGVNNSYLLNIYQTPNIPHLYTTSYYYDVLTYLLGDMDTMLPGDVFEMGDVFADYTHKGARYEQEKIWSIADYTVPAYTQPNFAYSFLTNAGGFDGTTVWLDRLQGQVGDQYRVTWTNRTQTNLTYVYENASVQIEFPYEVVPTSITCTGTHSLTLSSYTGLTSTSETVLPHSASYWVYGDDVEYTIPMSGTSVSLPEKHITKIALNYDVLTSASTYTYTVVANNADKDKDGKELGERYAVELKAKLVTENGKRQLAAEGGERRKEEEFSLGNSQTFYLIQQPDALLFGTYYTSSYKTTSVSCYNSESNYRYDGSYNWRFSLTKSKSQMKDYENVKITIKPGNDESGVAMSKIAGFNVGAGYLTFSSNVLVHYQTNKTNGAYKTYAITNSGASYLPLDSDEYVVEEVIFDLGTIDGSKMTATSTANIKLTSDYWNHSSTQHTIIPLLNEYRYYNVGNAEATSEFPVSGTDSHTLVAEIETSSTAKYITGEGGQASYNDKSTGTIKYITQWSATLSKTATNTTNSWSNTSRAYYRGDTIKVTLELTTFRVSSMTWAGGTYSHNFDDVLLYLEVRKGFSLSSLSGFDLLEIRELENGNKLHIYKLPATQINAYTNIVSSAVATLVVLPDADLGKYAIIENAGFSLDGFVRDYMTPADTYFNDSPYYKYTVSNSGRDFAAHWGILKEDAPEDTTDPYSYVKHQMNFGYSTNTDVTIQVANVDRISILPGIGGAIHANPAEFYDYQKSNLMARAWMANNTDSSIAEYEAVFTLPREGAETIGYGEGQSASQTTQYKNDFSLFLTSAVTFGTNAPPEGTYEIVYHNAGGAFEPVTEADFLTVTEVHVFINNFTALASFDCVFNLMTDYVKVGAHTEDIFSYIGAGRRYIVSADLTGKLEEQTFLYSIPAQHAFKSMWLKVRVGLDTREDGSYSSLLSNAALITVYYEDAAEGEKVLYSSSTGSTHNIPVNVDASRVTAKVVNPATYVTTTQKASGISEAQNSDFPRVAPDAETSLDVDINDLKGTTTAGNMYDVNLTRLPTVTANDLYLRVDQELPTVITVGVSGNPTSKYTVTYEIIGEDGIASLAENGYATGIAKGETEYKVTVTNTLGTMDCDTVTATAKIYVIDDFRVAMRAFWDNDYDGVISEGDEIVKFTNIAVAQEYFWLSTTNGTSTSTTYKQVSREAAYDSESGYYSFQVPNLKEYFAIARNPASTSILDDNAARSGTTQPVLSGAVKGYKAFTGSSQTYGSVRYDFSVISTDNEGNLEEITYIDFPIESPHTVTFKAENGSIIAGTSTSNMILVNSSTVQTNMETGEAFAQKRFWHKTALSTLYTAAQVEPDPGYTWITSTGSPYYNMRNWKRTDNGENKLKPEYSGWNSHAVIEDMTLVAVPAKLTLHARVFYDENRDGEWDEGEEILENPTLYALQGTTTYTTSTAARITLVKEEDSDYSSAAIPGVDLSLWAYYAGGAGDSDVAKPDAARFMTARVMIPGEDPATVTMNPQTTSNYPYASMRMDYTPYAQAGDIYVDIALQRPHTVTFRAENGTITATAATSTTYTSRIVDYSINKGVQTNEDGSTFVVTKFWPNTALAYIYNYALVEAAPHYTWTTGTATANLKARQWQRVEGAIAETNTEYVWYTPSYYINADMTFVALPTRSEYAILYDKNAEGATGTTEDPTGWYTAGKKTTVQENGFAYDGYEFTGWNTAPDGSGTAYNPGDSLTIPSYDITLYAQWNPPYVVEHYLQGLDTLYPLTPEDSAKFNGKTGTDATFASNTYLGFTYQPELTVSNSTDPGDFAIREDGKLVIKLYYSRNTNTPYTVEHYLLNLDDTIPETAYETENPTGTTGMAITPQPNTYPGFSYEESMTYQSSPVIEGDGSTLLKLYYSRNTNTPYTVEHYLQDLEGNYPEDPEDVDDQIGTTGAVPDVKAKTYPGFTFEPTLTVPQGELIIQGDGKLVVKLYYSRNTKTAYTVEHYLQDLEGSYPQDPEVIENLNGITGALAAFSSVTYPGFTYEPGLTEQNSTVILGDGSTLIKLYYSRNLNTPYTVAHYLQDLDGSYPESAHETENPTGTTGALAAFNSNTYPGFTYEPGLTEQNSTIILGDGSTLIKLYYSRNDNTPYIVQHYLQDLEGEYQLRAEDTQDRTGITGAVVTAQPNTYPGFTYEPGLTEPKDLIIQGDGSLVIKLYYSRNTNTPYTVEHYLLNLDGSIPAAAYETQNRNGTTGATVTVTPNSYPGFTYEPDRTTPEGEKIIAGDGKLVIKLYYSRNENTPYTVEHYLQDLDGSFPEDAYETESLTGMTGETLEPNPNDYPGFTFDPNLTLPAELVIDGDGNLVIKLFYTRDENTRYTVEHYLQDLAGTYTEPAYETENPDGTTGALAAFSSRTYPGFTYEPGLTEQNSTIILGDGSTLIKLYYSRNENTPYIVQHYLQDLEGEYQLRAEDTQDRTGITGAVVVPLPNTYPGFTYEPSLTEPEVLVIQGDGSLVIKLYYSRNINTPYTVEHYLLNLDGSIPAAAYETQNRNGTTGTAVTVTPNNYPGFTYQPDRTTPEGEKIIAGDGSLVIKLYYSRNDNTPYTVEHYLQDLDGNFPEDAYETENLTGMTGETLEPNPNDYPGFTFDPDLTLPAELVIDGDGNLVIKLFYTRDENTRYTVEHYLQDLAGTYTEPAYETENPTGTTGALAAFSSKTYLGFTYEPGLTEQNSTVILGDGSTLIKLYYSRDLNTPYIVEHYLQDLDGNYPEDAFETQFKEGTTGMEADATPNDYPGYTFDPGKTWPEELSISGDGTLVIKLYYTRDTDTRYTVKHYLQELDGTYPDTAENTQILYGTTGALVEPVPNTYPGFTFKPDATTPEDLHILGDGTLVISLFYTRDTDTKYTVKHYLLNLDGTPSATAQDTQILYGTTGTEARAEPMTYPGFSHEPDRTERNDTIIRGDGTTLINLYYSRNEDTPYIVEHYQEDLDGSYPDSLKETEDFIGTTGEEVVPQPKDYPGFEYEPDLTQPSELVIDGEGKLVIKLYYTRKTNIAYLVEHYQQNLNGDYPATPADRETHYGKTGAAAAFAPKTYQGFQYEASLTTPEVRAILGDGSLVIKLYYSRSNNIVYKVEHYQQLQDGSYGAAPVETEIFRGINGASAAYQAKTYPGYTYMEELTTPANKTILSDGSLVIKLYYSLNTDTLYKVEHYLQKAGSRGVYELDTTRTAQGTTGAMASFSPRTYIGYTYDPSLTRPLDLRIAADGSLVIKLYYKIISSPELPQEPEPTVPELIPIPESPFIPEALVEDLMTSIRERAVKRISEMVVFDDLGVPLAGISSKNIGDCAE